MNIASAINVYAYLPFFLLIFGRLMGLLYAAPFFGSRNIPNMARIGLAFLSAFIFAPVILPLRAEPPDLFTWVALLVLEILVGLAMGFVSSLLFYAIQVAGQFIDMQLGFGFANVVDPQSGIQVPVLGNYLQIIAMLIFILLNGHHWLIQAVFYSYQVVPIGGATVNAGMPEVISYLFLSFFVMAIRISIPVIGAVMLADVSLGIISRTVPQMNVFMVGMPLKIIVGFFVVALAVPLFGQLIVGGFEGMIADVFKILGALSR